MTKEEFDSLIDKLLDYEIEITLSKDKGIVWYDLNTMMKSNLEIAFVNQECVYRKRYDETGIIEDIFDIQTVGGYCMHGRDYASAAWHSFLKENLND